MTDSAQDNYALKRGLTVGAWVRPWVRSLDAELAMPKSLHYHCVIQFSLKNWIVLSCSLCRYQLSISELVNTKARCIYSFCFQDLTNAIFNTHIHTPNKCRQNLNFLERHNRSEGRLFGMTDSAQDNTAAKREFRVGVSDKRLNPESIMPKSLHYHCVIQFSLNKN